MSAEHPICRTCGVQYGEERFDPGHCKICEDDRQYVGWNGQQWTSLAELAAAGHRNELRDEAGVLGIQTVPQVGIGQRALLVPGEGGNVLWDCVPHVDDETVRALERRGGLAAVAVSHPHFYTSMVEWSDAFGGIPVYVHEADREWVCRDGNVVLWSGDTREILPGRTLINCGTHFPGGTVMHWAEGTDGRGALLSGDIFAVVMDRRWVSFMYSFPNVIPEHPDTITRAVELVRPFGFEMIYGAFWGRVVFSDAKASVVRSAERYLRHIGVER